MTIGAGATLRLKKSELATEEMTLPALFYQETVEVDLKVRFADGDRVTKVRSLRGAGYFKGSLDDQQRGTLEVKTVDGQSQVQMRLELTDYLLVN